MFSIKVQLQGQPQTSTETLLLLNTGLKLARLVLVNKNSWGNRVHNNLQIWNAGSIMLYKIFHQRFFFFYGRLALLRTMPSLWQAHCLQGPSRHVGVHGCSRVLCQNRALKSGSSGCTSPDFPSGGTMSKHLLFMNFSLLTYKMVLSTLNTYTAPRMKTNVYVHIYTYAA